MGQRVIGSAPTGASTSHWDSVDEAEWESFPASDPPAVDRVFDLEPDASVHAEPETTTEDGLGEAERRHLAEALDDEYKAWAVYDQVIRDFGEVRPFVHIRDAEARHIAALAALYERYGLERPSNTWPGRVPRFETLQEACEAALEAELANAELYERLTAGTRRPDILAVYRSLQRASQERHLPAFERCAGRHGARGAGRRSRSETGRGHRHGHRHGRHHGPQGG